ncbi:molybdenum cofactor guanylyltransferase [Pseudochryseolinea flava]|uniref:molybdenum cofactor guanylyltransferase n=1 Tax=Pseudochryseolinea flava TaxID=2059302 RepID=UPI0014022D70|nr:molybdenum cofactor guanylyltransferase [Pseudochryseolinea flava]
MNTLHTEIFGLILSGGRSLRMGQDKGLIPYYGKPQREYLHDLLSTICHTVHLSCKSTNDIPNWLNPLTDAYELNSPLNGIFTALAHNPSVAWLTVPVDMPLIDEEAIRFLIDHRDPKKLATCYVDSDGEKPEPLFTLWEPAALPHLQKFYLAGEFSPRKFLIEHPVNLLIPTSKKFYRNVNSPEDLSAFLGDDV